MDALEVQVPDEDVKDGILFSVDPSSDDDSRDDASLTDSVHIAVCSAAHCSGASNTISTKARQARNHSQFRMRVGKGAGGVRGGTYKT